MKNLKELNLSGNHLPFYCIDAIVKNTDMVRLDVSDCNLDDLSAYHIISKTNLKEVNLSYNPMLAFAFYD